MTDKELIQALREGAKWALLKEWEVPIMLGDNLIAAADLLEALLTENDRQKAQVPQWKPGSEPPPKSGKYIVHIKGATKVTTLNCYVNSENGKYSWFTENDFYLYDVTHWMPLPELPKMEDTP